MPIKKIDSNRKRGNMEFLYVFFVLFITAVTLTIIFKKKIEQVIPIAVLEIILIIYITGLFDNLSLGVLMVCISTLVQLIFIAIYLAKKTDKIIPIIKQILTPGFAIYVGLFILSIILNKGRIFEDYDEYNHWGIMIKNMFWYHTYGTNPESIVAFNDYPPLTSIFQYLFIQIKGIYTEDVIITAQNILYFSIIIPITKNITWEKDVKRIVLATMIIAFLPIIFYANFYTNILVDGILGIAFSYTIYSSYRKEQEIPFQFLEIFCGMTILMLTKTQGIGLALLAILIIGYKLLLERKQEKEQTKKKAKMFIIVIICVVGLLSLWHIKVQQQQHRWDLSKIYDIDIKQEQTGEFIQIVAQKFMNAIVKGKFITQRNFTTAFVILGIFALMAIQYHKIEKQQKKQYRYYAFSILLSTIIYLITMLWMYCTIFDTDEALILASFSRYIFTIVIADMMFLSFVLLEEKTTIFTTIILIVLICILLPFQTIQQKYVNKKNYITTSYINRWTDIQMIKYKNQLDEEDKILYISNRNMGNSIIQLALNQYTMMHLNISAVIPGTIGDVENLIQAMKEANYTHVYVYRATPEAREEYANIFEENTIENDTLYEVKQNQGTQIQLIKVKK